MTHIPAGFITASKPLPHAQHIFGTRAETMADSNATVRAATERFGAIAHMRQVHGNRVTYATTSGLYEDCDAIYTDAENLWLAVKTADCAPVLISSQAAVAAVHVGWRGLQAEILPEVIQTLCDEFNQTPEDLHLALGPCLSQPNFEVENEFQHYFNIPNAQRFFMPSDNPGRVMMDFPALVRAQALKNGILDIHFHTVGRCTYAEQNTFNSYRRHRQGKDSSYAVQLSLIQKLPGTGF